MAKNVTIQLSDEAYDAVVVRAQAAGLPVAEYLQRQIAPPSPEDLMARIRSRPRADLGDAVNLVREGREERERLTDSWLHDRR